MIRPPPAADPAASVLLSNVLPIKFPPEKLVCGPVQANDRKFHALKNIIHNPPLKNKTFLFFLLIRLLCHSFQFSLLIGCKPAGIQCIPDLRHHRIIEIKVVKHTEPHTKHFFCFQ